MTFKLFSAGPFTRLLSLPRRFLLIGCSTVILFYLFLTSAPITLRSPIILNPSNDEHLSTHDALSGWLPPVFKSKPSTRPLEFDASGQCLFLSPFDALSDAEKARASLSDLEQVNAGVVTTRSRGEAADDDMAGLYANTTAGSTPQIGMTHPILALLRGGELKWNGMLARQSKTLEESVRTYIERYGRQPPKGYDQWWNFAQEKKVLLPDEYDAILESLLPFYGLPVATVLERLAETEQWVETFTLIVKDGSVKLQWNDDYSKDVWPQTQDRANSQMRTMEPFLDKLGDFRATFTIHDQPSILLDHGKQQELLKAAKARKPMEHPTEDRPEQDWHGACPAHSLLNTGGQDSPRSDSFISSHIAAMNICEHPSYLDNHGMFIEVKDEGVHPRPHTELYPILVPSKTMLNGDIPVAPIGRSENRYDVGKDPAWNYKSGKLYWRGLSTGLNHNKGAGANWRHSHRERLHFLANDKLGGMSDVLVPVHATGEAEYTRLPTKGLGEYYMDAKLAGGPWQCDGGDGTCDEMRNEIDFADKDASDRGNQFQYLFDTDGNAWSSRFPRLMASHNVVIKATVFPEWNTRTLPEWFAYVPAKMDYSDLFSIMAFFRGSPSGQGSHEEVARRIALNGQCWVERTWRTEDLEAYMFRLYLEYARVISPDRDNGGMDFVL